LTANASLFISVFGLIFLAELPDKTAFATLLMAAQSRRPLGIFIGACLAFLVQTAVAILAGRVFGLLPVTVIHRFSGCLFLVFSYLAWQRRQDVHSEGASESAAGFFKTMLGSFLVVFAAEWGDLTQLATAVLEARYHSPAILFTASTLALWTATGVAVAVGHRLKKSIPVQLLNGIAAVTMAIVGGVLLVQG